MSERAVQVGKCECGALVKRRDLRGRPLFAELASRPFVCNECAAERERQWTREDEVNAAAVAKRRFLERVKASGLPDALRDIVDSGPLTPDSPGQAWRAAEEWGRSQVHGLLLTGPVGVGKTHMAAFAAGLMLKRRPLTWTSAPLLFARLGSGLGGEQHDMAIGQLTSKNGLVLDDMDKARPTEYGAENLFAAIDGRVSNGKPLLVTSNLSLAELAARYPQPYGEAIASRLAGYCEHYRLQGPDRRTTSAEVAS
jgi:DNA replication protein DnaC